MSVNPAHVFFDKHLPKLLKATAGQGRPVTCRGAGCFWCCKEPVLASKREAQDMVDALTEDEKREVAARTSEWLARFKVSGLLDVKFPDVFKWRGQNVYCPLLKDSKCMVYEKRPYSCRAHLATGPVEGCVDDEKRRRQEFVRSPDLEKATFEESARDAHARGEMIVIDNLGVWLAEILCGVVVATPAREGVMVSMEGEV